MASAARRRRLRFSTRFAIVLALVGALVAAVTVLIPLAEATLQARQAALDRVADETNLLVGLHRAEERSLDVFATQAASALARSSDASKLITTLSAGTQPGDVVGLVRPQGDLVASGGRSLDPASTEARVPRAAVALEGISTDAEGNPWLVARAAIPSGGTCVVARPLGNTELASIASDAAGISGEGMALVRDGRAAVDSLGPAGRVRAGQQLDGGLRPALGDAPSSVVNVGGEDVAAVSTALGGGYRLLVSSRVSGIGSVLRDVLFPVALITIGLVVAGLVILFAIVQRDVQGPLRRLDRAVEAMTREDFDMPVRHGGEDVIARLSESFVAMRRELHAMLRAAEARASVATELSSPASLDDAMRGVCDRLRSATEAAVAVVVLRGEGGRGAAVHAAGAPMPRDADALLRGEGPLASAARLQTVTPLLACATEPSPEARSGLREILAAPLRIGGTTVGVVGVADCAEGFDIHDMDLVEAAAEQIALAVERERVLVIARLQASTDSLTGLYNRRFLTDFLEQQVAIADRAGSTFAVVMLDIDHFKAINDTLGHEVGDEALRCVGRTLSSTLRRSDLAARLGGDEFIVVMSDTNLEAATGVAEKIRTAVNRIRIPADGARRRQRVSISVGVASRTPGGPDVDRLLTLVDDALYQAKHEGRDRVVASRVAESVPGGRRRPPRGGGA